MELKDELMVISGRKRRFLLLRIVDVGAEAARQLCGVTKGTYNSWLHEPAFAQLYRRRAELSAEYRVEALRLMRRDNQLQAVLLEEKIINKMKAEIESGEYDLIRSNLAREVYSKLIADLDYQPKALNLSWEQRVQNLITGKETPQIEQGGEVTEGEIITKADSSKETEHKEGKLPLESEQTSDEAKEKDKES